MSTKTKLEELQAIEHAIVARRVTPELAEAANHMVFGEGDPDAQVFFIGEAPGKNEDLMGRPFVGAAGKVLEVMLADVGMRREDVYITSVLKYRPPANRDPQPDEIQAFVPYLEQQVAVIRPTVVALLGRHAMSVFLPGLRIGEAHGQPVRKDGQVYLPLFHPAAALYNGSMRETMNRDFLLLPGLLAKLEASPAMNLSN